MPHDRQTTIKLLAEIKAELFSASRLRNWVLAVFVAVCPLAAQAELSCADFHRGVILDDSDVLQQAADIEAPLLSTGWPFFDQYKQPSSPPDPDFDEKAYSKSLGDRMARAMLITECSELPDDTLDSIVATHMKTAPQKQEEARVAAQKQEEAKEEARKQEEAKQEALMQSKPYIKEKHYRAYADLLPEMDETRCRDYTLDRPNAKHALQLVFAWSVVEDDDNEDKEWREMMHGAGAPKLPRLDTTMAGIKPFLDKWCAVHPSNGLGGGGAADGAYAAARRARFGVEIEDTPAMSAQKRKEAATEAAALKKEAALESIADRAGPRGSCPWELDIIRRSGGPSTSDDEASIDIRRTWYWCLQHPKASADALTVGAAREP